MPVRLETSQFCRPVPVNADASINISNIDVTDPVCQLDRFPSKSDAPLNIPLMVATEPVCQFEMSPVKDDAPWNTLFICVTALVSH